MLRDNRRPIHYTFGRRNSVSTQANLCPSEATTYESDDETSNRRRWKRTTPLYSKQDIREQYCISDKQIHVLEAVREQPSWFGCISSRNVPTCSPQAPANILSVCVKHKMPSDENLYELSCRPYSHYSPFSQWRTLYPQFVPHPRLGYRGQFYHTRQHGPAYLYDWLPEAEQIRRMDMSRHRTTDLDSFHRYYLPLQQQQRRLPYSNLEHIMTRNPSCPTHQNFPPPPPPLPPPPPPPPPRLMSLPPFTPKPRHVSFANSHTLASFDNNAVTTIGGSTSATNSNSQERLLDGKKISSELSKETPKVVVMEKVKKTYMKTQATQTEVCLGRKPLPPNYRSLGPRTVHRSAQTNSERNNLNRKLTKSFSELYRCSERKYYNFCEHQTKGQDKKHEPLLRTQSEEPPNPKKFSGEILINFEPQQQPSKKSLQKTCSDGEIFKRKDAEKDVRDEISVSDCEICYQNISNDEDEDEYEEEEEENDTVNDDEEHSDKSSRTSVKFFSNKQLSNSESIEEEFHENLIYNRLYRQHSTSSADSLDCKSEHHESRHSRKSPTVSNDSLDTKDHSDSIWNESVTTVLPADSDNNGAAACTSCSELGSPLTLISKISTSSKRKLLLLQHQQTSSMDTETLDIDDLEMKQIHLNVTTNEERIPTELVKEEIQKDEKVLPNKSRLSLSEMNLGRQCLEDNWSATILEKTLTSSSTSHAAEEIQQYSCRVNQNDMSETSTTDGYITATDSFSAITSTTTHGPSYTTSSFDSVSSHLSFNKTDTLEEFQQVSQSPPKTKFLELEMEKSCDNDSISGSSSCERNIDAVIEFKNLGEENCSETDTGGRWKNEDEQQKHDLSADSGYRTIKKIKNASPQNINMIVGNGQTYQSCVATESSEESSDECSCDLTRRVSTRCRFSENRSPTTFPRTKKRHAVDEVVRRRSIPSKSPSSDTRQIINDAKSAKNYKTVGANFKESSNTRNALTAVSAESLRSASPGSDSVFYSEHSSTTAVELSTSGLLRKHFHSRSSPTNTDNLYLTPIENIVQPPAGFEDRSWSCGKTISNKLPKKSDKRYRSEERWHTKSYTSSTARAKSEEREIKTTKKESSPGIARSTDVSLERFGTSYSSVGSDDDDWVGIYAEPYLAYSWLHVSDWYETVFGCRPTDENDVLLKKNSTAQNLLCKQKILDDITDSENEFHEKYETVINNIVHWKMSNQLQKCISSKLFKNVKRVIVCRDSTEYGFRIRGSRPVIVSVVESASPAAYSGLQVGDVILCINNYNVLNASHSDVLRIFQDCTDSLELEVAETKDILSTETPQKENKCVQLGYMWRQNVYKQYTSSWMFRFFKLKEDRCLYSYRNEFETIPLGAVNLTKYTVQKLINFARPNTFLITKKESRTIYLSTETTQEYNLWISLISSTANTYNEEIHSNQQSLAIAADNIEDFDYRGLLSSLVHYKGSHWKKQFCILKEARLYFFFDMNANEAIGIICLHGYKVQSTSSALRRHAFELIPPNCSFKHFLFYTETSIEKRKWMAAMEQSIGRWILVS